MNREGAPRILLVDDDQAHNQALATILERAGYLVRIAGEGTEALMILGEQPFDLVITDLNMPEMNGLDLLRRIRDIHPDLTVLVLTAYGDWATYIAAMDWGALNYLNKPVRREEILTVIRKALARRGIRAPDVPLTSSEIDANSRPL